MSQRDRLKSLAKLIIGLGLVIYVLRSKMVDFRMLQSVLWSPGNLILASSFIALAVICCATRWHLLARAQGLSFSLKHLLELTMIGNFFNTFMPGSVGGDLVKAWYVAGSEPKRKAKAVFTVLLDRSIGLTVIVLYSAVTLLFYSEWLDGRPELRLVAISIWAFSSLSLLAALLFFTPMLWRFAPVHRTLEWLHERRRVRPLVEAALLYRNHLWAVLGAVILSMASILGITLLYKLQGNALGISLTLPQYFFMVPLALTVSAVPLLPGGIGVGQVAFYTLFLWVGHPEPDQGGALCTLIQIYTLLFNCLGGFFYARYRRNPAMGIDKARGNSSRPANFAATANTPAT